MKITKNNQPKQSHLFPECEKGFLRLGSRCYTSVGKGQAGLLEERCNKIGSHLWAPRAIADFESVQSAFP